MDTLTKSRVSRLSAWGWPHHVLPPARLQGLLKLSYSLLDAEAELAIMRALGAYLADELKVAEALFLLAGPPDTAFTFNELGEAQPGDESHTLMAAARAGLRGVVGRPGSSVSVANVVVDAARAALAVRWNRHRAPRMLPDQELLLAHAGDLTIKAVCKLRARECARALSESSHAIELARRDRLEEAMRAESLTDAMTGLTNRRGFFLTAEHAFRAARRRRAGSAVIFADVDNLKAVNDQQGHEIGDALIRDAAEIFRGSFRSADIVARLGGDEFVAYTLDDEHPEMVLKRVNANIEAFNARSVRPYVVSFSTGVVACDPLGTHNLADYLVIADQKMYEHKHRQEMSDCRI